MSSPSPSQPFGSALYGQPTSLGLGHFSIQQPPRSIAASSGLSRQATFGSSGNTMTSIVPGQSLGGQIASPSRGNILPLTANQQQRVGIPGQRAVGDRRPYSYGPSMMGGGSSFVLPGGGGSGLAAGARGTFQGLAHGQGAQSQGAQGLQIPFGMQLGGSGVLDGSLIPPNLDPSEFPSLSARNFGVTENGGSNALGSRSNYVGIIKNPSSDAAEFTMSSEDFPALPGTQNDNSSNPGNETKPSTVSSTQNIITGSVSSSGKRGLQISSDGKVTNIPPNMVADQFGMAGLLTFIRVAETDSNLVSLALGSDLTTLGLNLNSPEPLYTNFGGPWADNPCRPQDIDFHVPPEYQINAVIREKLAPLKLSRYQEDLLFYLFYTYVGDVIQIMAATELYNRDWRFHKEERIWITRATGYPMNEKTATFERGTYFCFDPHHWRKMTKELYVEYDKLEERPSGLPANMVLPFA